MKSHRKSLLFLIISILLLAVLIALGVLIIKSRQPVHITAPLTSVPGDSPGLVVYGTVRNVDGEGMEGVAILRSYSAYPGVQVATTNAAGYFQSDFYPIPGDEMVSIWAEQPGVQFQPASCSWRHYYGHEHRQCDFTAASSSSIDQPNANGAPSSVGWSGVSSTLP